MQINHVLLPLLRGSFSDRGRPEAMGFIGSASIIEKKVCTCSHVIEQIDFEREIVLTKWNPHIPEEPWVIFSGAIVHPRFDFAVLQTDQSPPHPSIPIFDGILDMGLQVYAFGFHDDGFCITSDRRKDYQVAPRSFLGNVVRVHQFPNNKSPSLCELSFPTLSGFSGAPVLATGLEAVVGMIYGNVEQKITVHERYELRDGNMEFSETVNRILELGLFHSAATIRQLVSELDG